MSGKDDDARPSVPRDTTKGAAATVNELTPRERLYNQILHSAPPPPPTERRVEPTPPPPPPIPDRTAKADGPKLRPPQPPASSRRRGTTGDQVGHGPAPHSDDVPTDRSQHDTTPKEDDPDTDVQPPQLMGVEFAPAQISDGQQTLFTAIVNDNLSGVRSVSGVIASPSGSVQGFACQREGDTDRYVSAVKIPVEAPEGVWRVKYLTLTDNATNSVNLSAAQGALPPTASFRVVSSGSDSTGPTLRAAWLDRMAMRGGERNTLFVQADDDKSGVGLVSCVFVSPSKQARMGFGCRLGEGGAWECTLTAPPCLDCGLWRLEQLQIQDKANNMATFRADNQIVGAVTLDISGQSCDSSPPALSSISLNPLVVSNAEDATIEVRAILTDDGCGVASLSGQAIPPGGIGGQRAYFSLHPTGDGQTFVGQIVIQQHAAKGVWTLSWLQALDKGHNLRAYPANDPVISQARFRVE